MPKKSAAVAAAIPVLKALPSRIVGHEDVAPDQLLAHPLNFRRHPGEQLEALRGSLNVLGWIKQVLVNRRTGHVLDGHARIEEALRQELASIPVTYVDLSEEEEKLALAVLDPISALAYQDDGILTDLLEGLAVDDAQLGAFLDTMRKEAEPPAPDFQEFDEDAADTVFLATCPKCGHQFPK